MEEIKTKYPRTYHVPWSPGATSDDKKLPEQWFYADGWAGSEIVITEKMDGEGDLRVPHRYEQRRGKGGEFRRFPHHRAAARRGPGV